MPLPAACLSQVKHRPIMAVLDTGTWEQQIHVAKVPDPFPVETARAMKPADEERLGQQEVDKRTDEIERVLALQPPDTPGLFTTLTQVSEG